MAYLSKWLSKWSMADVFVVSILIAYFVPAGFKTQAGEAKSYLKPGFFFFAAYCVISMFLNQLSWMVGGAKQKKSPKK